MPTLLINAHSRSHPVCWFAKPSGTHNPYLRAELRYWLLVGHHSPRFSNYLSHFSFFLKAHVLLSSISYRLLRFKFWVFTSRSLNYKTKTWIPFLISILSCRLSFPQWWCLFHFWLPIFTYRTSAFYGPQLPSYHLGEFQCTQRAIFRTLVTPRFCGAKPNNSLWSTPCLN